MIRTILLAAVALAVPAHAQHAGHHMPGMTMPAAKPKPKAAPVKRKAPVAKPAPKPTTGHEGHDMGAPAAAAPPAMDHSKMDHGGHDMGTVAAPTASTDHSGHDMPGMHAGPPAGTALPAGNAPAPPATHDNYADRQFPPAEMARARKIMMRENGGQTIATLMFNLAEYRANRGRDGYHWDAEGSPSSNSRLPRRDWQ